MATPAQTVIQQGDLALQRAHQLQDEQRQQNLQMHWGVINNPDATPEQKQAAQQGIQSLYPDPSHGVNMLMDMLHLRRKGQVPPHPSQISPISQSTTAAAPSSDDSAAAGAPPVTNPAASLQGAAPQVAPQAPPQGGAAPAPAAPSASTPPSAPPAPQNPALAQAQQKGQSILSGYASPQDIQNQYAVKMSKLGHEQAMELYGLRGQTAMDVAQIRAQYQLLSTPEKMYLDSQAKGMGFDHFFAVPPQLQGQMLTQYHNAATPSVQSVTVQDANSPTGFSRATYNANSGETYDVYQGITPPRGFVPTQRVSETPGPNGIVRTVSSITPGLPTAQPFVAPPAKTGKENNAGGPQGKVTAPPVSQNTPAGPLQGTSTPPDGGAVGSTAPPPQESGAAPVSANTPSGPPAAPANAGARQPGTQPAGGAVKKPVIQAVPAQRPDSHGEEIPPLRRPDLPPLKGADEARIASITAPVHAVEAQVVGRGRDPLWELADVLKNPEMLKLVNSAMLAPMLQTPEGTHNISFWGTVATSLGLASAAQQATSDVITQARNKVQQEGGDRALRLLDRLAELKGSVPNLRKVQGGSNALGAMEPLYQELPLLNISSPEDFRYRTANMMRTMADSLSEQPGVNRKHIDWLYGQADKAEKSAGITTPAAGGKNPKVDNFLRNFK